MYEGDLVVNSFIKDLIKYVDIIVSTYASTEECAKDFNIDEEKLKDLLKIPLILNSDMCNIVSVILGNSVNELIKIKYSSDLKEEI